MAMLYSQYGSGLQLTAGAFAGSVLGASGINILVDRLNSITNLDNVVTGSLISGTTAKVYSDFTSGTNVYGTTVSGITLRGNNVYGTVAVSGPTIIGNILSGTDLRINDINAQTYVSGLTVIGETISGTNLRIAGVNAQSYISGLSIIGTTITGNVSGTGVVVSGTGYISGINARFYGACSTLYAGEGINITAGSLIAAEDATTSNKGVASFAAADFAVSSGAVSLDDDVISTLDGDTGTATGVGHSINILGGDGITTEGAAPTGDDLTVALTNKTSYMSIPGNAFTALNVDTDQSRKRTEGIFIADAGLFATAQVQLPNGAVVTGAIVYGNISDETWTLQRITIADETAATLATTTFNSEDTTISNATVDNSLYAYWFSTSSIDATDAIWGARITYTTDYI